MKKFLGLILLIILMFNTRCYSAEFNILVLPNNMFYSYKDYIIFPDSAEIIANDVINYYNELNRTSAISVGTVKNILNQEPNKKLKKAAESMLDKYSKTYVVDYETLQRLAYRFKANKVLLIACNMDASNYITRRTLWDALNIPGATVVDPAYRLTTQITLVDVNNKVVLWQHNYQKLISSRESRIMSQGYSPAAEQLEKVKKYSTKFLAPQVVQETQLAMFNMSEYQDLNLYSEIVKPNYVSIDKVKIDSKRGSIRLGRHIKKETKNFIKTQKQNIETAKQNHIKYEQLSAEEKTKLMHDNAKSEHEKAMLNAQKQHEKAMLNARKQHQKALSRQKVNREKARLKQELDAEKAQLQLQLQQDAEEAGEIVQAKSEVKNVNNTNKKTLFKKKIKENVKNDSQTVVDSQVNVSVQEQKKSETKTDLQNDPILKDDTKDIRQVPFIRLKPVLRETDYTINDL